MATNVKKTNTKYGENIEYCILVLVFFLHDLEAKSLAILSIPCTICHLPVVHTNSK